MVVGSQLRPAGPRELIGAASCKIPAVTKSSFLILHGLENHRPPDHWQFWLAARLVGHGHRVLYPGLPTPDHPDAEILKLKDVIFGRRLSDVEAQSAHLPDIIADTFGAAVPLLRYLAAI